MQEREQMVEELRKQERAKGLLREAERRLGQKWSNRPELEYQQTQLEWLAESFPESHMTRLLIESAVGSVRAHRASKAGSDVSRSHSALEGRIFTLRGVLSRESSSR